MYQVRKIAHDIFEIFDAATGRVLGKGPQSYVRRVFRSMALQHADAAATDLIEYASRTYVRSEMIH